MQSLIRSKSVGVTGGRGTAGAGPGRDLLYKPAWKYTIGSTPNFGSFQAAKMTQIWDPNFPLPCGQLAAPFL